MYTVFLAAIASAAAVVQGAALDPRGLFFTPKAPASSTTSKAPTFFTPKVTPTTTTSRPAAFTPSTTIYSQPNGDIADILTAHNLARSSHGAAALTWNATVAATAKAWAEQCHWYHGGHAGLGQNLAAAGGTGGSARQSGQSVVDAWMSEEKDYDPSNPTYSHFTQVVWKSSTALGCWQTKCSQLLDDKGNKVFPDIYMPAAYTVCDYYPPGNYIGQFSQNVQKSS